MKIQNKFDSKFRQKAREIKIKPNDDVWNAIDNKLSQRKRTSIYSIVGIAATLLILVGMFSLYATEPNNYVNPNYQVMQVTETGDSDYDSALMKWVTVSKVVMRDL